MRNAAEILAKYGIKTKDTQPGRYYTPCPRCSGERSQAHQKVPCLGITIDDQSVTFGCNHCGWTGGEYFNSGSWHDNTNRIIATYDYVDENGELLFQVCRRTDKSFPQRKPDGRGGWSWTTAGVRKVIYRLPEVIEAVAADRTFVVVEGEKDVDNLWKIGAPARAIRAAQAHRARK